VVGVGSPSFGEQGEGESVSVSVFGVGRRRPHQVHFHGEAAGPLQEVHRPDPVGSGVGSGRPEAGAVRSPRRHPLAGVAVPPRQQILQGAAAARASLDTVHQVPEEEGQGDVHLHPDHRVLLFSGRAAKRSRQSDHAPDREPERPHQRREQGVQLRGSSPVGGGLHRVHHAVLRQVEEELQDEEMRGSGTGRGIRSRFGYRDIRRWFY
jgi:hypothetical protein